MPVRIVSYNVRYFGHALRGLASTRGSKRGVAEALAGLHPAADIVCLQEVETISLRSRLAFRKAHDRETQLEAFMAELEMAFEKKPPPFPYDAFYFRAHVNRLGNTPLQTTGHEVRSAADSFIPCSSSFNFFSEPECAGR